MDCVYIFKGGESEELLYSIRSAVKNLPHSKIWIVGGKPSWYFGNHIQVDQQGSKYSNAKDNLLAICNSHDISDSFVLMNDDFFITKPVHEIPEYNGGSLSDKIDNYTSVFGLNAYSRMLIETGRQLQLLGITEPLDYELHIPMVMDKDGLREALGLPGVLWRSYYGNTRVTPGEAIQDVKIYSNHYHSINNFDYTKTELPFISTDDLTFHKVKMDLLVKMFPDKSNYEL